MQHLQLGSCCWTVFLSITFGKLWLTMARGKRLGHSYYLPELSPQDKAFADFWSPLEPDLNTVKTFHRVEFLRAMGRIPEAQAVLTRLQDEVLPHYDDAWPQDRKLDALRALDSLALAEQQRPFLSPYGTALLGVLEKFNLKADWIFDAAIWTLTAWARASAEGKGIRLEWTWPLYGPDDIDYRRYRQTMTVPIPHENEMTNAQLKDYLLSKLEEVLERRKRAREAQGWRQTPSKTALALHAEYAVHYQVLEHSPKTIAEHYREILDRQTIDEREVRREIHNFMETIDLKERPPARGPKTGGR